MASEESCFQEILLARALSCDAHRRCRYSPFFVGVQHAARIARLLIRAKESVRTWA